MLDYNEVKRYYADKLAQDLGGNGRIESAFYHTMKMVYLKGVEDGQLDRFEMGGIDIIDWRSESTP